MPELLASVLGHQLLLTTGNRQLATGFFAGEHARRVDLRRDFSTYLVFRDYAPVREALIPGRTAVLRVVRLGAKYLSSFATGEMIWSQATVTTKRDRSVLRPDTYDL